MPKLDRSACHAQELALVEIENLVKDSHGGKCGFAHAHRADFFRLDERDVDERAKLLRHAAAAHQA
jgi:hypothetical protein